MSSAQLKAIRLPEEMIARIEAIAKAQGIKFSAAMRFALQRGVAALEQEANPAAAPRRKVISKGVF